MCVVLATDVQKSSNLKHVLEFILEQDVLQTETNCYMLCHITSELCLYCKNNLTLIYHDFFMNLTLIYHNPNEVMRLWGILIQKK